MMADPEADALQQAQQDYADALAALQQPDWSTDHAPADPYGRTFTLVNGDLEIAHGADGQRDLTFIVGKEELAQGLQVLISTLQGSDIFNVLFGFDIQQSLMQPQAVREMRALVRLNVVKALAQEPRIRQIRAIAFVDEKDYLLIHPEVTLEQQAALAQQQRISRRWKLDVLLDTRLGDEVAAGIEGVGP
jgi:phage baseplate assembly protein W